MRLGVALIPLLLSGCAIAARSDRFGADLEIGIGGILSYIADLRIKANVGFSKTQEARDGKDTVGSGDDPYGLFDFL